MMPLDEWHCSDISLTWIDRNDVEYFMYKFKQAFSIKTNDFLWYGVNID